MIENVWVKNLEWASVNDIDWECWVQILVETYFFSSINLRVKKKKVYFENILPHFIMWTIVVELIIFIMNECSKTTARALQVRYRLRHYTLDWNYLIVIRVKWFSPMAQLFFQLLERNIDIHLYYHCHPKKSHTGVASDHFKWSHLICIFSISITNPSNSV
jgi:hypothetical protein